MCTPFTSNPGARDGTVISFFGSDSQTAAGGGRSDRRVLGFMHFVWFFVFLFFCFSQLWSLK